MTTLREAATAVIAAYDAHEPLAVVMEDLRAALAEHYCDTHCTWADHAPGCVRAEPEPTCNGMPAIEGPLSRSQRMHAPLNLNDPAVRKRLAAQWGYTKQGEQDAEV